MKPQRAELIIVLLVGLFLIVSGDVWSQGPKGGHPNTDGWPELFKPDLSNALMDPGGWTMENGVLTAKDHGAIWTKEAYGNFILDLEFKVAPRANSGVFLRCSDINDALSALEVQVHESTDGTKYGMVSAIYDAKPPSKKMAKPAGEWNHFTIRCRDSLVGVIFNGERVIDIDLNDWKELGKNPDGTPNKFHKALKDFSRSGKIGFQGIHGREAQPVWYRNIRIRVLKQ